MTCILFHQGDLLTDSKHVRDDGPYQSMHKVTRLETPFEMHYDPSKMHGESKTGLPAEALQDRIYGYVIAGNEESGHACARMVRRTNINLTLNQYALFCDVTSMVNYENGFNLVLIGEKGEYVISVHPGERTELFRFIGRDNSHAYGSGGTIILNHLNIYDDLVTAVFATYLQDASSGGMIDCWRLPTEEKPVFQRMGIYEARTTEAMREIVAKNDKVLPDMVAYHVMLSMMKRAFRAGLFVGQNPRASAKMLAKLDDMDFFMATTQMFGGASEEARERNKKILKEWIDQGLILPRWNRLKKTTTRRNSRDK